MMIYLFWSCTSESIQFFRQGSKWMPSHLGRALITDPVLFLKMVIPTQILLVTAVLSLGAPYIYSKVDKPFKTKFHIPFTQECIAWKAKVNEVPVCESLSCMLTFFGSSKLSWLQLLYKAFSVCCSCRDYTVCHDQSVTVHWSGGG